MTTFGEALRAFRQASNDPDRLNRRLTQERLGQLIGHELGDLGFTGAAISDWERGESRISADDRKVLIALVSVLHRCSGLKTIAEADQLLKWGGYRPLDEDETRYVFQDSPDGVGSPPLVSEARIPETNRQSWFAEMFSIPQDEVNELFTRAREGPKPVWPRVLAAFLRKASDHFSISFTSVLWIWVWLVAWWWIGPSLQLPYANRDAALLALGVYAGGSLIVPLLIGLLVNTKDSDYWKERDGASPFLLRLYTYQGAGIGFNVGYFMVFPLSLVAYYLGFRHTVLIDILAATVSVVLGNMAAHVVPHNLWRAYKRLSIGDGGIFFAVALMGPLWAFFFVEYHAILLRPAFGIIIILLALTLVVFFTTRPSKKPEA